MKFGYSLRYTLSLIEMPQLMSAAENAGFDTGWVADDQLRYNHGDPYAMLALCGIRTKKIKLGVAVTNPYTRHITVTANSICTINEISKGRAIICMAAGDSAIRSLGIKQSSAEQCGRAINQVKKLCTGQPININGVNVKFDRSRGRIPVYLAASGKKMLKEGGKNADGILINAGVSPKLLEPAIENIREGAISAGRKIEDISLACVVTFCLSEDRRRAKDLVKPFASFFQIFYPDSLKALNISNSEIEKLRKIGLKKSQDSMHAEDYEQVVEETKFIPDYISDNLALGGNVEDFEKKISDLEKLGINEIFFRPFFTYKIDGIEGDQFTIINNLGKNVISKFK